MTAQPAQGERITLDPDFPEPNRLVRHARVLADLLFSNPPPAYSARVSEYVAGIQGRGDDGLIEWAQNLGLEEIEGWTGDGGDTWREFRGVINGVEFEVTCDVTL